MDGIYRIITYFSLGSALLPFLFGLIRLRNFNRQFWLVFIYSIICIATELICYLSVKGNIELIQMSLNVFTLLETGLFLMLYYLEPSFIRMRVLVIIFSMIFYCIAIITFIVGGGIKESNNIISTLESCLLIFLSISFFFNVHPEEYSPRTNSFFWLNTGVLLYFITSFVLFLFSNHLAKADHGIFILFYSLQKIVNVTYNIILTTAIWKTKNLRMSL